MEDSIRTPGFCTIGRGIALSIALFSAVLSGCATSPPVVGSAKAPVEVAWRILDDLMRDLIKRFPPAKTSLAIHDQDRGGRLERVLRDAGYAVHQKDGINPVTFSTHYARESAMYLGVIRVGLNYTLSRLYVFEGGELQGQSTSLSDEAATHSAEITGDDGHG